LRTWEGYGYRRRKKKLIHCRTGSRDLEDGVRVDKKDQVPSESKDAQTLEYEESLRVGQLMADVT